MIPFDALKTRASGGEFRGLFVTSDAIDPVFTDADVSSLRDRVEFLAVQDVQETPLALAADAVLAAATFAEKAGCYVNADGRLQYSEAALPPRDGSLPDLDILAILANRYPGPVESFRVLADLARELPAFGVAEGGQVPVGGVLLAKSDGVRENGDGNGRPKSAPSLVGAARTFEDPWLAGRRPRGDQVGQDTPKGGTDA